MRTYPVNEQITAVTTFLDPQSNKPVNPGLVVFRIRDPDGVETRPAVTNSQAGVYSATFTPAKAGRWHTRWEGVNPGKLVVEHQLEITPSAFT